MMMRRKNQTGSRSSDFKSPSRRVSRTSESLSRASSSPRACIRPLLTPFGRPSGFPDCPDSNGIKPPYLKTENQTEGCFVPNRFNPLLISMGNRGAARTRSAWKGGPLGGNLAVFFAYVDALRPLLRKKFQGLESSNDWKTHLPRRVAAGRPFCSATL